MALTLASPPPRATLQLSTSSSSSCFTLPLKSLAPSRVAKNKCTAAMVGVEGENGFHMAQFSDGGSICFAPIINGCWTLAGGHGRILEDQILRVMEAYAERGLTSFDTADIYGPSEAILGKFHEQWQLKQRQRQSSQSLQIFTKFVPNIFRGFPSASMVEQSIRRSIQALRLPKLNLVQLHWWDYEIPGMVDVAKTLTDLKEKGLITSIGTTNMSTEALAQIVDAGVPVVCNQVQFSLLDRRPLHTMLDYCQRRNIKLLSYGSLAGGLLSDRYIEEGKKGFLGKIVSRSPDLNTSSLKMYWRIMREAGGEGFWRKLLDVLRGIASKHSVSVAAIALRWVMQQGSVHPIVGLRNASHLDDNLRVFSFSLTESDLAEIDDVLQDSSGPAGDCYELERTR